VGEARYTPYGEMRRDYPRGVIPTDRLYTGQRQETFGLYDYGARYYSPGLGRWISADALVPNPTNPQSLNRYAYVSNSPVVYLDPDGRFAIVPVLIVAGVVVLKAVDYGWTAYDVYQSGRTLADPNADRGEKLLAGLNIALAVALEAGEPDDEIPVSLPLDDLGRRAVMAGARRALAEGGEEALERYLRERLGAQADEVLEWVIRKGYCRKNSRVQHRVKRGTGLELPSLAPSSSATTATGTGCCASALKGPPSTSGITMRSGAQWSPNTTMPAASGWRCGWAAPSTSCTATIWGARP